VQIYYVICTKHARRNRGRLRILGHAQCLRSLLRAVVRTIEYGSGYAVTTTTTSFRAPSSPSVSPITAAASAASEPKALDGTLLIHDRATSDSFVVYSPRFVRQFHAGHHAGKWYLRPLKDLGAAPCSRAFPAAGLAVDALRTGRWSTSAEASFTSRKRPRVIWSRGCASLAEEGR
jgi:hypothetical protein